MTTEWTTTERTTTGWTTLTTMSRTSVALTQAIVLLVEMDALSGVTYGGRTMRTRALFASRDDMFVCATVARNTTS